MTDIYSVSDFPLPPGATLDRFSIKQDASANKLTVSATVWLQSVYELHNPAEDTFAKQPGGKKYTVGLAVPKTATGFLSQLKKAADAMMLADGVKGAYPHAIKDGAAQDGNGLYVKAGGRLQEWAYWSAKSKRPPIVTRKEGDHVIEVPVTEAIGGTWAIVLFDLIPIAYGGQAGGGKRGTSAWISRLHLLGGGKPIQGGGRSDDTDFMSMVSDSPASAAGGSVAAAGGGTVEALF
jgi:hypothetical protein